MNGLWHKAALLVGCALGLTAGCDTMPRRCGTGACGTGAGGAVAGYSKRDCDLYDRCWPDRYTNLARRSVNHSFAPQVLNGHVLDQTVWNAHFEAGTDRLTPGGLAHLQYIARRRPCADRTIYLATSLDLAYDPNCPDRYCGARQELDTLRVAAVQKYLTGLNCGRAADFTVLVHDPADPGIHTGGPAVSVPLMYARYRGGLPVQAGGAGAGGGGGGAAGTGTAR